MADADKTLNLLIKLGVIGKEDAQAANDLLSEMRKEGDQAAPVLEKLGEKTESAAEATEKFSLHGEGARKVIGELNRIAPGLGEALHGIEKALTGGNTALILLALTLKAVATYWEAYQEKAKAAAEEVSTDLEKHRQALIKLRTAQDDFNTALTSNKTADYIKELGDIQKVLQAQIDLKKTLLKVDEATETAAAKAPEEKAAVQAKYAKLNRAADQAGDGQDLTAITNERIAIGNEKRALQQEVEAAQKNVRDLMVRSRKNIEVTTGPGESADDIETINRLAGNVTKKMIEEAVAKATEISNKSIPRIKDLEDQDSDLADRYRVGSQVGRIKAQGREAENNAPPPELIAALQKQAGGVAAIQDIVKYHLEQSTKQEEETAALWRALRTLQTRAQQRPVN